MNFEVEKIHKDILTQVQAGEPFSIIVIEMYKNNPDIQEIERTTPSTGSLREVYHLFFKDGSEASITRWFDRYLNDNTAVTIWYSDPTGEPDKYLFYPISKSQS